MSSPHEIVRGSLDERYREAEIMDDPQLGQAEHFQALRGLSRLNWASRSAAIVWRPIWRLSQRLDSPSLRVLDVASGAGDVLLGLWRIARRHGLQLDLHGTDVSSRAIEYAGERADSAGAKISYSQLNALEEPFPAEYDVLVSSLFFHHLSADQAVMLLEKMSAAARHLLLVNDLRRCRGGLCLAHVAGRLLTRSPVVHTDGPRSVRAAFTPAEMQSLAERANLIDADVQRRWPCRFLCQWAKSG